MIQMSFKAYLLRRSQALCALRELAVAKTKLKEVRAVFNNFTYRSRIAHDAEERQRFAERIIVVLLTVDAIEPLDKYLAIRRRRMFDVPDGHVKKEVANGVAQIVRMLDQDEKSTTSTSEV
ncbi:hypothetical protein CDL15_Pgr016088 [Punica granatum]|uniref:BAG domain-containing protein n=1 Tax=Punica granatum TaxID=22663 RepID=A0A218X066_PUNGR|nr:hypothetical protein CDL15_Pgr016088 [Punica granatum]